MSNGRFWQTLRTVALDLPAQQFIDANSSTGDRFSDQWDGIVWLLCRTPEVGMPRDRQRPSDFVLLVIAGNDMAKTNDIWLLYSFDDGEVTIHAVRFGDATEDTD